MDTSWQGNFSQQMAAFGSHMDGGHNHEDWEEWLRWDPAAVEATSPEDGTFNSGSSKNDSPLQDPSFPEFLKGNDEPLVPPLIVGGDDFGFAQNNELIDPNFPLSLNPDLDAGFGFDQAVGLDNLATVPKLDTTTWSLPSNLATVSDSNLPVLPNEQDNQPPSAASVSASTPSLNHSPASHSHSRQSLSSHSPEPTKKRGGRKRKAEVQLERNSPETTQNGESQDGQEPFNKTSHNVIEKRYRNNLNDKIVELRNSVPSLRAMGRANGGEELEDLEGLTPAHKLNKATVMAKATEYIKHLEKRNKTMADEMAALKARLNKVEAAIDNSSDWQPMLSNSPSPTTQRSREPSSASQTNAPNFLNLPTDQTRYAQAAHQQQYLQQQGQPAYARPPNPPVEAQNQPQHVNGRGNGFMSKAMLGTMAGVMVMEGFGEHQQGGGDTSSHALFSIPTTLFKRTSEGNPSAISSILPRQALLPMLKIGLVISALLYLLGPLVFYTPRRKQKMRPSSQLPKVPSLASPVEVRRKAWDTAIQTVWVPKHFLLEVVAVGLKMFQLSIRRLIGAEAFTEITGTNKEEEAARIKGWDIAIDAQLAGGDAQVSYYRLLLTLMESGTLPDSPARLMQKAVHFRVFFWEVANAGYGNLSGFKHFTEKVGRIYWDSARRLQKEAETAKSCGKPGSVEDEIELLPDHLAQLLELECDDVLGDEMIQRAWNLAWNKPSSFNTTPNGPRDNVVEDHAIRSPLDAVAAWYTNMTIDDTLIDALGETPSQIDHEYYLRLALSVAPPASSTHVRALAAKAVLSNSNRHANVVVALEALPVLSPTGGMNLVSHAPASPDVCTALTLAKLMSLSSPSAPGAARERAFQALSGLSLSPASFSLLTCVAAYRLLRILMSSQSLSQDVERGIEGLAGNLRVWVGTSAGRDSGLGHEERGKIVKLCLSTARQLGGWDDKDSGYGSSRSSSPLQERARLVVT